MSERTFKVKSPLMQGQDVEAFQQFLYDGFRKWNIAYPIEADGYYGAATRGATASFMRAWGVADTGEALENGLTPEWRIKLRNYKRSDAEEKFFESDEIIDYRRALRERFKRIDVCYPVPNLITDAWDWHGTAHDGVDLICPPRQPVLAICRAKVVRAGNGWSGLYAPAGDGIIILQALEDVGPIQKGWCFGYGHAENPIVSTGDVVEPGEVVGEAGNANVYHLHLMLNGGGFPPTIGHGDRDPKPILNWVRAND